MLQNIKNILHNFLIMWKILWFDTLYIFRQIIITPRIKEVYKPLFINFLLHSNSMKNVSLS